MGVQTYPVPAGFCSDQPSFIWAFAVNSWERETHLFPVIYWVYLDTNKDGAPEYAVINGDPGLFTGAYDGRQYTWSYNLSTGYAEAYFYAEHAGSSANTVLYICGEQVGLTGTDMLSTPVGVAVEAWDYYFGGPGDLMGFDSNWALGSITITPLGEQYFGLAQDVAGMAKGQLDVYTFPPVPGTTPDLGMLLVTNGDRGASKRGGATVDTEAMLFSAPGVALPKKGPTADLTYGQGMARYNPGSGL